MTRHRRPLNDLPLHIQIPIGVTILAFFGFGGWAAHSWLGFIVAVGLPLSIWASATFFQPERTVPSPGQFAVQGGDCALCMCQRVDVRPAMDGVVGNRFAGRAAWPRRAFVSALGPAV